MRLSRRSEPFDSDLFIYELNIDGFRALAHIQNGEDELISRNGNTSRGFAELATWLGEHRRQNLVLAIFSGLPPCILLAVSERPGQSRALPNGSWGGL